MAFFDLAIISILPITLPWIVILSGIIILPIELLFKWKYLRSAKKKLYSKEYENLIKIGITGSFGKTSCKNMLRDMLSKKYNTVASPSSFNTPMGFTKTINGLLKPEHEVLIMEMGARYKDDIRYLAKLVKPHHGILTSIGAAHLDTMKSLDGVKAIKSELIKALHGDGIGIINADIERCVQVFEESPLQNKHLAGIENETARFRATNLSMSEDGCTFDLIAGKEKISCTTRLLGKHNIQNIVVCAALSYELGVTLAQIAEAVAELEPTPHRLELIKSPNGVTILDDSYNATPTGIEAALDVLRMFKGTKVVQTPGLVEMGSRHAEENFKIGMKIAKVADKVIIVGDFNKQSLTDGLIAGDFAKDNISHAKTLDEAKDLYATLLKKGDVLLISNDLPDNYV